MTIKSVNAETMDTMAVHMLQLVAFNDTVLHDDRTQANKIGIPKPTIHEETNTGGSKRYGYRIQIQ